MFGCKLFPFLLNSLFPLSSKTNFSTVNIQMFNVADPDNYHRLFQGKEGKNVKVNGPFLAENRAMTKIQCAIYCIQDNTCTQFSYHGDVVGNNCLLGSAISGEENQDGWTIYST